MTNDTPYLPCPFCGSADIDPTFWLNGDGISGPGCGQCGATGEADGWNRRALDVERLVEALVDKTSLGFIKDPELEAAWRSAYREHAGPGRRPRDPGIPWRAAIRALVLAALGLDPNTTRPQAATTADAMPAEGEATDAAR